NGRALRRIETGPNPRNNAAMAFDAAHGVVVLYGGEVYQSQLASDTWTWNGNYWTFRGGREAGGLPGHAMAYDSDRHVVVMFSWAYTSEWNGASWSNRSSSGPPGRAYHSMAYDPGRHVTVLFGGSNLAGTFFTDTWEWDGTTWTQRASS